MSDAQSLIHCNLLCTHRTSTDPSPGLALNKTDVTQRHMDAAKRVVKSSKGALAFVEKQTQLARCHTTHIHKMVYNIQRDRCHSFNTLKEIQAAADYALSILLRSAMS